MAFFRSYKSTLKYKATIITLYFKEIGEYIYNPV